MGRQPQAPVRNGQIGIHHRTGSQVDSIGCKVQNRQFQNTRLCQQPLAGAEIRKGHHGAFSRCGGLHNQGHCLHGAGHIERSALRQYKKNKT